MSQACVVNGVDLRTLGVIVESVRGLDQWPARSVSVATQPGWDGARITSSVRTAGERVITVTGHVDGRNGLFYTRLDALADLLEHGLLEVEFPARRSGIRWYAVLDGDRQIQAGTPDLYQPWVRVEFTLRCPDPFGYETAPVLYAAAASTQIPCPVRTARSLPTVLIIGPYTNPILIHRHADGTELGRITLTDTAADATTYLRIITDAGGEIRKVTSSTDERDDDLAAAGWWVPFLLPEYAVTGADQSLEVSSGSLQVSYTKAVR